MRTALRIPAALALASLSACVSVEWDREIVHREVPEPVLEALPRGGVPLAECLALLGAPTLVREHRVHGLVLAWSWWHRRDLGASVSVPLSDWQNASFAYNQIRTDLEGVVLWFDEDWMLVEWRSGHLHELLGEAPRPATVTEIFGELNG